MNPLDQVLTHEMTDLLERLASTVPGGCLSAITATRPTLRKRLDEMEDHLTHARASVLDGYGRWRRALEDLESLWALGAYRIDAMDGTDLAPEPSREGADGAAGGARSRRSSAAEKSGEPARSIAA
jgi:hypothetical protein